MGNMKICRCGKELTAEGHPAGKELDVCVAKARGQRAKITDRVRTVYWSIDGKRYVNLPDYSEDIRDAMTLWRPASDWRLLKINKNLWSINNGAVMMSDFEVYSTAPDLAHVIALTFLIELVSRIGMEND